MKEFATSRDAKEFMVSSIVSEAEIENVVLSKIEQDMLYFTETAWTPLPDYVATSDAFERECNPEEYERKVEGLIHGFIARTRKQNPSEFEAWKQAVQKIQGEDHYLLVMVGAANRGPKYDGLFSTRIIYIAILVASLLLAVGSFFVTR